MKTSGAVLATMAGAWIAMLACLGARRDPDGGTRRERARMCADRIAHERDRLAAEEPPTERADPAGPARVLDRA